MQGGQEWVVGWQRQDALFRHGALNVVVLDDDVLFEDFDGKDFFRVPLFCQHHFAERAFAQDFEEPKVFQRTLDFAALSIHDFFECCHLIITVRFQRIWKVRGRIRIFVFIPYVLKPKRTINKSKWKRCQKRPKKSPFYHWHTNDCVAKIRFPKETILVIFQLLF